MDHDASLEQDPPLLFDARETERERESERARASISPHTEHSMSKVREGQHSVSPGSGCNRWPSPSGAEAAAVPAVHRVREGRQDAAAAAAQHARLLEHLGLQSAAVVLPGNGVSVYGAGGCESSDESASEKMHVLDMRMEYLKKQLARTAEGEGEGGGSRSGGGGATAPTHTSPPDTSMWSLKRPSALPISPANAAKLASNGGGDSRESPLLRDDPKPSPPATPPPPYAALRGKGRLTNGSSGDQDASCNTSPPAAAASKIGGVSRFEGGGVEVLAGERQAAAHAAAAPAEPASEIERRRALLRNKLAAADDVLAPPLTLPLGAAGAARAAREEVLSFLVTGNARHKEGGVDESRGSTDSRDVIPSPPKLAGKGSVVQDESMGKCESMGKYFEG